MKDAVISAQKLLALKFCWFYSRFGAARAARPGVIITLLMSVSFSAHALIPSPPQLAASSYLLIDANSGKVLVEYQADEQLPPASLTKIMTAYIAFSELARGSISESDDVSVSVKAWKMGGSKMFIREGTTVPLSDLLRGIIIQSGNDASVAIAEHIAGSEESFAEVMNQQAYLLGMNGTHFENATGWPAEGHFTTARDLSKLALAMINDHPSYYSLYSEKEFTYNDITQANRNGLLWRDKSVDGIKTGHTDAAGYCLVSSAERDGMRLISVVMGTSSSKAREQETQKLLTYGFRYFETHKIYDQGSILADARIWGGESESVGLTIDSSLTLTVPRGRKDELNAVMEIDREILAPVKAGESFGVLKVSLDGEVIERRPLITVAAVEQSGIFSRLWDQLVLFVRGLLGLE